MAYLRESINKMEEGILARRLKETGDWEEAKAALPTVDPHVLDKGFKKSSFKAAGIDMAVYDKLQADKKAAEEKVKTEVEKGKLLK